MKTAAGFVIYRHVSNKIEYLLLQTSYGIHHWTPPKGHVDPGETELVTAFRETVEESGLEKHDLKVFEHCKQVLNYQVNGSPKKVVYWLAELVNPNAEVKLSNEHQDFKWVQLDDACTLASFEEMQNTLQYFDQCIHSKCQ